ncbi:MAG: hypothetical protein GX945_15945 [Lentisphaerae bacterium]|nr:hypothetical protein [Lentisphaerota bacterium]
MVKRLRRNMDNMDTMDDNTCSLAVHTVHIVHTVHSSLREQQLSMGDRLHVNCRAAAMRDMPPQICAKLRNLRIKSGIYCGHVTATSQT